MRAKKLICLFLTVVLTVSMVTISADAATSFAKKPAKVKAKCVSAVAAKVSCAEVGGATGYVYYVAKKKNGKYSAAANTRTNQATISGLSTGKTYYFKVKAYKGTGPYTYGKLSKAAKCKIVIKKPALKIIDKCDCKVQIKMTGSPGAKGFLVYRSTFKNKKYKLISKVTGFTYLDTGLKKNTKYYYKIRAFSGNKRTGYTKATAVKTNKTGAGDGNGSAYALSNAGVSGYANKLKGREILFLGSSITAGRYSGGVSFVDYINKRNGSRSFKLAVSGTRISGLKDSVSYVNRLKTNCGPSSKYNPDVFVCQLSLNDAVKGAPLGSLKGIDFSRLSGDAAADAYLKQLYSNGGTVAGAIEYITAYAYNKWPGCQVVFFTVRDVRAFKNYGQHYAKMRSLLYNAQKRYGKRDGRNRLEIIDMWSNSSLTNLKGNTFCLYMNDVNHPKRAGYLKQWTPEFEKCLSQWMPAKYTITFKDPDEEDPEGTTKPGNIWKTDYMKKHDRLKYTGETPTKEADEEFTYEFAGWASADDPETKIDLSTVEVTGDVVFIAIYNAIPIKDENDGTEDGNGTEQVNDDQNQDETTANGDNDTSEEPGKEPVEEMNEGQNEGD